VIRVNFISGILLLIVLCYSISPSLNKKSQNRLFPGREGADNAYHYEIKIVGKKNAKVRKTDPICFHAKQFYTEVQLRW
jgi:hypothetical protein